ncbi:hypothetical protein SAMN04515647_4084 [Cohaesibacter sp. ES.047]|uniref:hypothetical protein n=1 Tax=Cohaesibacter sp. ES.047 TaxID=1798205 RepID=UPI000BB81D9E|nr:hypothetical protein [Cohaesibacter sp. ES.047]SNY93764.1 hypothetical protein SAMN04515647_4084 [Cohaesibacter sp. ES.047]
MAPPHADRQQFHLEKTASSCPFNNNASYSSVVRRTILFQLRLAADGLRDLLLSPICVIAALLGLLKPDNPSWALDRLMSFGRVTDHWINLFEQNEQLPEQERAQTSDDLFDHMETEVKRRMDPETVPEDVSWSSGLSAFVGKKPASN